MPPDSSARATSEPPSASVYTEQGAMPPDSHVDKGKGARSSSTPANKGYDRGSAAASEQPFNVFGDFFSPTRNVEPMKASTETIPLFRAETAIGSVGKSES